MQVAVYDNFAALPSELVSRLDRAHGFALFDRPDWYQPMLSQCLERAKPLILSASDGLHHCAMFLARESGAPLLTSLANWYSFHWRPVFGGQYDEVTKLALLGACGRALAKYGFQLELSPLPEEDDSHELLARALRHTGWIVDSAPCDENHILTVAGRTFDEYWASRPGQLRSTVKRKGKKGIVQLRIETAFSDESWADYEAVYSESWKPTEGNPDFLRDLANREAEAGCMRMGLAYIEGQPVAAQFWTVEHGEALIHKLAHTEASKSASPGSLLSAALFQHVIDVDGVHIVDFGTGNDPYKRDWMDGLRHRHRLTCFRPQNPLAWPALAKHRLRELVGRVRSD